MDDANINAGIRDGEVDIDSLINASRFKHWIDDKVNRALSFFYWIGHASNIIFGVYIMYNLLCYVISSILALHNGGRDEESDSISWGSDSSNPVFEFVMLSDPEMEDDTEEVGRAYMRRVFGASDKRYDPTLRTRPFLQKMHWTHHEHESTPPMSFLLRSHNGA
ncbi:hypothetical protein U1Q18_051021 [Sarracenia purpurea var. burkii]